MGYDPIVNYGDSFTRPPKGTLCGAAAAGDAWAGLKAIRAGANAGERFGRNGWTALHWAAWSGSAECVGELLEAGSDANGRDSFGSSPLHVASMYDRQEAAAALADRMVGVDLLDRWGRTPLHLAATNGSRNCAFVLLTRGAAVNAQDKFGQTALHHGLHAVQALPTLLHNGIDARIKDNSGETALFTARRLALLNAIEVLKANGVIE